MKPSTEPDWTTAIRRLILVEWAGLSLAWLSKIGSSAMETKVTSGLPAHLLDLSRAQPRPFFSVCGWAIWEVPQAFSALVGSWWWAMGAGLPAESPFAPSLQASLLLAALATARVATRFVNPDRRGHRPNRARDRAASTLANGVTRHFMPEGLLMAAVALTILAAQRWAERPTLGRAVWLGAAMGAGLLTKQTFILLALPPVAFLTLGLIKRQWVSAGVSLLVTLTISGPWWLTRIQDQLSYASASAAGHGSGGFLDHALYYPTILAKLGLGPPLTALGLWATWRLLRQTTPQTRRGLLVAGLWLVGGLFVLSLIPKKYPRLLAPLTPSIGILLAMVWARGVSDRRIVGAGLVLGAAWTLAASTGHTPLLTRHAAIDPGCPQQWLRAPSNNDLGLSRVAATLSDAPPGGVSISQDIAIPCDVQTTHDWAQHLGPYLRRSGSDREVEVAAEPTGRFIIRVSGAAGGIPVEGTGQSLHIHDRLGP